MNKKGFTLTELLGVIVVLAVIVGIAMTSATSIMNKSKVKLYEEMENNLKDVAITYYLDTQDNKVTVGELIDNGYFEDNKGYCKKEYLIEISVKEIEDASATKGGYVPEDYEAIVEKGTCGN